MTFFDNSNWKLTKFLLSCFGAWPLQSPKIRKIIRMAIFLLITSIFIPEIPRGPVAFLFISTSNN
ncbi:Protein of unknown function [Cotesia congregata]|uniref:Uncharacterized protein n=1 Tax=Cotesia congregata TaxID=51543 RepID=A0A8J2H801_COTCN|nr:Protein of unknown function [Cotesia congregata]